MIIRNIIISTVFLLALVGCESNEAKIARLEAEKQTRLERECSSGSAAYVWAQTLVRPRLRSPSTADFPFADYKADFLGDCTHTVSSYVDAQNGFGATIRTNYSATVKYSKKTDTWTLVNLHLENR